MLHQIFQHISYQELFQAQCISHGFCDTILSSLILRRTMFLSPSIPSTVIPLKVADKPLRIKVVRTKVIWVKTPSIDATSIVPHPLHGPSDKLPTYEYERLCIDREVPGPKLNPVLRHKDINWKLDIIYLRKSPVSHTERALRLVPGTMDESFRDSRRDMLITQPPVADVVVGRSDTKHGMFEAHNATGVTIGDVLDAEKKAALERRVEGPPLFCWTPEMEGRGYF